MDAPTHAPVTSRCAHQRPSSVLLVWLLLLAACRPPVLQVIVAPATCGWLTLPLEPPMYCTLLADDTLIVQTNGQTTLTWQQATVTLDGALYWHWGERELLLAVLEGTAVVGVNGAVRVVVTGAQLALPLREDGTLSARLPTALPIEAEILTRVQNVQAARPLVLPSPIAPPLGVTLAPSRTPSPTPLSLTDIAIGTHTPVPTVCVPREDWRATVTVRSGDVLSRIAARYNLPAAELAAGNCLTNPDRIRIGQVLRVPSVPTATPPNAPTPTPSLVFLRTDKSELTSGECTVVRWDVFNVESVYFEETLTTGNNAQPICPATTTTYTLRVVYFDGTQTTHSITVRVSASP